MFRKLILLLSALMLMTLASCKTPEPKAEFSTEKVCQNLYLFTTSVDTLKDESGFSDKNALQAQFEVVRTNFNNLVASVANLEVAEKDDFESAVDELMNAVGSLPEDISVSDALKSLEEPIKQVREASENLKTGLECK